MLAGIDGLEKGEPREARERIFSAGSTAVTEYTDGDEYEFIDCGDGTGNIILTNYCGSGENVVVPAVYKGNPVVELRETFNKKYWIGTVEIENGVRHIGDYAFCLCKRLTCVTIPKSVQSIGFWAFNNCHKLTIRCAENSAAHQYARDNNIRYELD